MNDLFQNQTAEVLPFLMVQSSDHETALTGASPVVTLSKNGSSFAAASGTVSEIGNGWYAVAGNATDSNTLGPLLLHATASGGDPADETFQVKGVNPRATVVPANTTQLAGQTVNAAAAVTFPASVGTSTLIAGAQMDLVNTPNPTAVSDIVSGLCTSSGLTSAANAILAAISNIPGANAIAAAIRSVID